MNKKELIILRIYLNKFPICSPISLRGFPVWLSCCCPPDVPADWLPCCCPPDVSADCLSCCCPPDVPADWLPCCCPPCCCPPCCCPPCCCPPCCCPPCCCPPDVPAVWFCELPSVWANMGFDKIVETIPIANSRKV